MNTYKLPNGLEVQGQNINGTLCDDNGNPIMGLYFRGTGRVPQKYTISVGTDKVDGHEFICGAIGTHSGQIQEQHSNIVWPLDT